MGGRDTSQGDSEPAAGDRGGHPGSRRDPWDDIVERVKERLKGRDRPHIPENDMDVDPHAPAGHLDDRQPGEQDESA